MRVTRYEEWAVEASNLAEAEEKLNKGDVLWSEETDLVDWEIKGKIGEV